MKKNTALFLLLVSVACRSAYSESIFFAILRPYAQIDSWVPANAKPTPTLYADYYAMPALINFGWEMNSAKKESNVDIAVRFDLRHDFWTYVTKGSHGNIPFAENGVTPIMDFNYPTVGYASWQNDHALVSFGRRKLKWGPGTYDIALADTAPYFDHLWASYESESTYGSWWYNFITMSMDRVAANGGTYYKYYEGSSSSNAPVQKTVLAHRIGFENEFIRIGFGELNVVYSVSPDLQDIGPFLIYHHLYQDANSNVLMTLSAESLLGPARVFGEFVMDDLSLGFENPYDKPTSMGWFFGGELDMARLFGVSNQTSQAYDSASKLRPNTSMRLDESDYALREATFRTRSRLTIGYEHYRTTTYLYNRSQDAGKFTVPDHRFSTAADYIDHPAAFFIGFLYGPDTSLDMISIRHQSPRVQVELLLKLLRQGAYGIMSPYIQGSNTLDWFSLAEPVATSGIAELSVAWRPSTRLLLEARASAAMSADSTVSGYKFGLSATWRLDVR